MPHKRLAVVKMVPTLKVQGATYTVEDDQIRRHDE